MTSEHFSESIPWIILSSPFKLCSNLNYSSFFHHLVLCGFFQKSCLQSVLFTTWHFIHCLWENVNRERPHDRCPPQTMTWRPTWSAIEARNLTQVGEKGKELQSDSFRPYVGRYRDVPRWRVDTHVALLHDLSELMAKRTMESALL